MWIKNICKFYGDTNAPLVNVHNVEKALIISKVNKRENSIFNSKTALGMFIILLEILIWFMMLKHIVDSMNTLRTFGLFTAFYIFCILTLQITNQAKFVGDTIIIFTDKIVELNWLYSKETLWSDVNNINIYQKYLSEDIRKEFQEVSQKRLAKIIWNNIVIKANKNKIFINTAYSHNEEILNYIKEKHGDKINNKNGFGKTVNQIGLLMLEGVMIGPFIVGVFYLLNHYIGF